MLLLPVLFMASIRAKPLWIPTPVSYTHLDVYKRQAITEETGDSRNQIHRYIRLTNLVPELLDLVDEGKIKMRPAVELSYLRCV